MANANEQFKFPDENLTEVEVGSPTPEVEVEIIDDTPAADKGRRALDRPVEDPSDEELASYSDKVQSRIKDLTHARHDERRSREAIQREKAELERMAQHLLAENNQLKSSVNAGQQAFMQTSKEKADADLVMARAKLKAAHEAFDTDAIVAAQEEMGMAQLRAEQVKNFRVKWRYNRSKKLKHRRPTKNPCAGRHETSGSGNVGLKSTPASH